MEKKRGEEKPGEERKEEERTVKGCGEEKRMGEKRIKEDGRRGQMSGRGERRQETVLYTVDVLHPDGTLSHCVLCTELSTSPLKAESPLSSNLTDLIECGLICTLLFSQ